MGIPIGLAYIALFSPPPNTPFPEETSTPYGNRPKPHEDRDHQHAPGIDLNLNLNTPMPAQVVHHTRRGSRRRSKWPVVDQAPLDSQVVVLERYLQELLA